jgi:Mg2+ and Co2+ transporter CorA
MLSRPDMLAAVLSGIVLISEKDESAFELTGAWAASADQCGKVFIRKGRANEIAFTARSDRHGGGFIVEANRVRGKYTTCTIKVRKDDGQALNLIAVCAADIMLSNVISDMLRDIAESTDETGYLRFVMTERLLVSGRHHALCAVDATRRALEEGHRIESAAALLETIVEKAADTMDRVADRIATSLDEIEEQVLSDDAADLRQGLGRLRRTCVRLHRQLSGLRIVFHRLEQKHVQDLKPALQLRAGKLAQRLDGLDHTVVEMRERSRLLQEELHLKIEEQGNNNIRVLSVLRDTDAADTGYPVFSE